jgi:hypothetical protein
MIALGIEERSRPRNCSSLFDEAIRLDPQLGKISWRNSAIARIDPGVDCKRVLQDPLPSDSRLCRASQHFTFIPQLGSRRAIFVMGFNAVTFVRVVVMERALIWVGGDAKGWACSKCRWKFPVPTLLTGEEAKGAYDRLAAAKFREHKCDLGASLFAAEQPTRPDAGVSFAERARMLIKRGYTPKIAADLVLHEMEFEHASNSAVMEKARADAEDFLLKVRKGLI